MMDKMIDCLFIGHNDMNFAEYEQEVRKMGIHSGAYRDLDLNFIWYENKPYSASDIFNLFYLSNGNNENPGSHDLKPLRLGETFSAAIAYLGTYLNRRGFLFDYVNSFQDDKEELAEKLEKENIRTIAVITTLYVSVLPILEIMEFIKTHNQTAKIIIGGPFVSTQYRVMNSQALDYLFKSINADIYVNSSQGEAALVNVIHALKHHLPLDQVSNIYYKYHSGYVSTSQQQEDNQLSENMVDWRLFSDRIGEYAALRTSISCPYSCAFCGFPEHAGPYQTASIEAVEKELNLLANIESVKSINVIDDTFNIPKKRFKDILRRMIKNQYGFKWHSHFRCQFVDREMLELMKESGCEGVFLGIESGSDEILKRMNKSVTVKQYLQGIALLKEYEISSFGSFIIGFPGETDKTVQETRQFIEGSGLDFYRTQLWYCDTTTPIWKQREKYKITGSSFQWTHAAMDAQQACDCIEDIFVSIQNPTWVPQYNFEYDGLFHLIHRGFTPDQVLHFIKSFTQGVKEKITTPARKEVGLNVIKQLYNACQRNNRFNDSNENRKSKINRLNVTFDF